MPAQRTTPATGAAPTPADAPTTGLVPVAAPMGMQWLLPSLVTVGFALLCGIGGVIWTEIKASEARLNTQIGVLREDLRANETRQREDVQVVREDVQAVREDLGRLEAKVDRLLESR